MKSSENVNYRNFCDALDVATESNEFIEPSFAVSDEHSKTQVIDVCWRELDSIKEDASIYPEHMNKWFRAVLKLMGGGKMPPKPSDKHTSIALVTAKDEVVEVDDTEVETTATETKRRSTKPPRPTKLPKSDVPFVDSEHVLNGKKVAFLFDTRYGRLTRMVSDSKNGFEIKGRTIHNIDSKKSKVALLKNFGDAMKPGNLAEAELADWMTKCVKKGAPIAVGTRLADEILVLHAA